ncbi:MAG: type II secretion system protein J [Vulcanimicrobiota bacterium]
MRSGVRAYTLVEVLVAAFLMSLLLTVLFQVLFPLVRASHRSYRRISMQEVGGLALDRLARQFEATPAVGVTPPQTTAQQVVLALHPIDSVSSSGRQFYADHLEVFHWRRDSGRLIHETWTEAGVDLSLEPRRLTAIELQAVVDSDNGSERVLAHGVTSFVVAAAGSGPGLVLPLTVTLKLEDQSDRLELSRRLYLMNSSL